MNAGVPEIPYPWLVFNEKVKVNTVFLRDSTAVSDSVLLLFGGNVARAGLVSFLYQVTLSVIYTSLKVLNTHPVTHLNRMDT